jgi:GTPase Era involved in 16S rRNA processing
MKNINLQNVTSEHSRFGLELIERFTEIPSVKDNANLIQEIKYMEDRFADTSFKIAVVGEFSSGKSTFLNALIGKDYLSHSISETTATITMLVNKKAEKNQLGCVYFSNKTKKILSDFSELKEVTTTQSTSHQVISEIDCVEIYIPFMDTDIPVVLIDTPGLNGVADKHRERTIEIVKGAHACIYMLQSRGISDTDKSLLQWISRYQRDLIVIQNFIDDINHSEGNTVDDILEKQKQILDETVFPDDNGIHYTVCGVSSLKALVAKDFSFKRLYQSDTHDLTDSERNKIYEESNFEAAIKNIDEFMKSAFIRSGLATLYSLERLFDRTYRLADEQYEVMDAIWQNSIDAQVLTRTHDVLDNWEKREEENTTKLENFVLIKMNEHRRFTVKTIGESIGEEKVNISKVWRSIDKVDEWDRTVLQNTERAVRASVDNIKHQLDSKLEECSSNTYVLALQRIQEYAGLNDVLPRNNIPELTVNKEIEGMKQYVSDDAIQSTQKMISDIAITLGEIEFKRSNSEESIKRYQSVLLKNECKQNQLDKEHSAKIQGLGEKPEVRKYTERKVTYEDRSGFFGWFVQIFAGKEEVVKYIPRCDDSAQKDWENEYGRIKNEYNREKNICNEKINKNKLDIKLAEKYLLELHDDAQDLINQLKTHKELLEEEKKVYEQRRRQAAQEYLQLQKNKLESSVFKYLDEEFTPAITTYTVNSFDAVSEQIKHTVKNYYMDESQKQREQLVEMLSEKGKSGTSKIYQELKRYKEELQNLNKTIKEYLCKQQMQIN